MTLNKRSFSLRSHLVVLVLAAMIPFFIFLTLMVNQLLEFERAKSENRLQTTAYEMALSIDQELLSSISTLKALAVSHDLETHQFKAFHETLKRVQQTQPNWVALHLHSKSKPYYINSLRNFDEKLSSPVDPQSIEKVYMTGEPVITCFKKASADSHLEGRSIYALRVPVLDKGQVSHVLSAVLTTESMQKTLIPTNKKVFEEWSRAVVDSSGIIVARSRSPEKFVGEKTTADFQKLVEGKEKGITAWTTMEGTPGYLAFHRAPYSKWYAVVVVPKAVFDSGARKSKFMVITGGLLMLLAFGGLAVFYADSLSGRIHVAAQAAHALAKGEEPQIEPSSVAEVEQLRVSLASASTLLKSKDEQMHRSLEEAQAARADAEKANRAKSHFLANMSHEIRTPLGVVVGLAELFAAGEIEPEAKEPNLRIMKRNSDLLLTLINDILDLSRVEAQKMKIEREIFSLRDFIHQIIEDLSLKAQEKNLLIRLEIESAVPEVLYSDTARLRQIIYNILGNAIKFTERGEIHIVVKVESSHLVVLVQDTGIGMKPDLQKSLFSVFTQGDDGHNRKFGGTGLGLALSKKLAQLLGGDLVLLESKIGVGSVFRLELPLD